MIDPTRIFQALARWLAGASLLRGDRTILQAHGLLRWNGARWELAR